MKLQIRQFQFQKVEVASKEIELPTETCYFFETGIRRSIKVIPEFTTWNKETYNKEEELHELKVICLYQSYECKMEKFSLLVREIEEIYYSEKHEYKGFIAGLIGGWFNKRTKEQFDTDFNNLLLEFQS